MIAQSQQATYTSIVLCFPQMKPETASPSQKSEADNQKEEGLEEEVALDMVEDEKLVLNLLKANSPIDLNALKEQTGLSNKKWDKAIKGLTKNKLAKVEKTDAGLFVSVV
jgi:uncharacterized membrane protein